MSASAQTDEPWTAAVTGLTVTTSDDGGELEIAWDAHPEGANDYRVSWADHDGDFEPPSNTDWNASPTTNSHTITGLTAGDQYKVRVRAFFDNNKRSDWSDTITGTAGQDLWRAAVTGLTVTAGTDAGDLDPLVELTADLQRRAVLQVLSRNRTTLHQPLL